MTTRHLCSCCQGMTVCALDHTVAAGKSIILETIPWSMSSDADRGQTVCSREGMGKEEVEEVGRCRGEGKGERENK